MKKIFIHLEKRTPPEAFDRFGPLVVPVRGGFQLCLALFALGLVDEAAVQQCRDAVSPEAGTTDPELQSLIADAIGRRLISRKKLGLLDSVLPTSARKKR